MVAADRELISGDGTGEHLTGLLHVANSQSITLSKGGTGITTVVDMDKVLGQIYMGIGEHETATELKSSPSHFLCHPNFLHAFTGAENDAGFYWGSPATMFVPMVWGMPVVKSTGFDNLAAAKKVGAMVDLTQDFLCFYVRKGLEVLWGYNDQDFSKFDYTIRGSIRCALVAKLPQAITIINTAA